MLRLLSVLLLALTSLFDVAAAQASPLPSAAPSPAPALSTFNLTMTVNGIRAVDLQFFGGFNAIAVQLKAEFQKAAAQYAGAWMVEGFPLDLVMLTNPGSTADGITISASVPLIVDAIAAKVLVNQLNTALAQSSQCAVGAPPCWYYTYAILQLKFTVNSVTVTANPSPSPTPNAPTPTPSNSPVAFPSVSPSALPALPNTLIVVMLTLRGANFADLLTVNNGEGWIAYTAALQSDVVRLLASVAGVTGIDPATVKVALMGAGPEGATITPSPLPTPGRNNATRLLQQVPTVLTVQISIPITERAGSNTAAQYAQLLSDALSINPGSYLYTSMAVASQVSGVVVQAELASVPTVQPYFPSASPSPLASRTPASGGGGGGGGNNNNSGSAPDGLTSTGKIVGGVFLAVGASGILALSIVFARRRQRRYRASMAAAAAAGLCIGPQSPNPASPNSGGEKLGFTSPTDTPSSPRPASRNSIFASASGNGRAARKSVISSVVTEARRLSQTGSQRMLMLISPRLSNAGMAVNNPLNAAASGATSLPGSPTDGSAEGGIAMTDASSGGSGRAPRVSMLASLSSPSSPSAPEGQAQAQRKGRSSLAPLSFGPQPVAKQTARAAAVARANKLHRESADENPPRGVEHASDPRMDV